MTDIGQEFTLGAAGRFCRLICCFQFLRLFPIGDDLRHLQDVAFVLHLRDNLPGQGLKRFFLS